MNGARVLKLLRLHSLGMIKEEWLEKPPMLHEMLERLENEPVKRKQILVGIPVYNEKAYLLEQLRWLQRQRYQNFDIFIALSPLLEPEEMKEEIKKNRLPLNVPIIWAKRKEDYGSAGGFYIIERYAVEKGYAALIEADVDCLPTSDRLIETLFGRIKNGYDVAMPRTLKDDRIAYNLRFYSMIRTTLLKKVGVTFLPFFYWAEDVELMDRVKKGGSRIAKVDEQEVRHPFKLPVLFLMPSKLVYYRTRNYLMALTKFNGHVYGIRKFLIGYYQIHYFLVSYFVSLLLRNPKSGILWEGIKDAIQGNFKNAFKKKFNYEEEHSAGFSPEIIIGVGKEAEKLGKKYGAKLIGFGNISMLAYLKNPVLLVKDGVRLLLLTNKSVFIVGNSYMEFLFPIACVISKEVALRNDGALVLRKNTGFFRWLVLLIVFVTGVPFLFLLSFFFTILALVSKPKIRTMSYGV